MGIEMEYLGKTGSKNMLNLIMLHFHKVFERAKNPAARRPFCKNIERLITANYFRKDAPLVQDILLALY